MRSGLAYAVLWRRDVFFLQDPVSLPIPRTSWPNSLARREQRSAPRVADAVLWLPIPGDKVRHSANGVNQLGVGAALK